eukprot:11178533-Lingulodinium_polyedra.AAC.1
MTNHSCPCSPGPLAQSQDSKPRTQPSSSTSTQSPTPHDPKRISHIHPTNTSFTSIYLPNEPMIQSRVPTIRLDQLGVPS